MATLMLLASCAFKSIASGVFSRRMWHFYIMPGVLVFVSMSLNVSLNTLSNGNLAGFYGLVIPWAAYLCVPGFLKSNSINTKTLWRHYFYFMLAVCILGLLEYVLVFSGMHSLRILETPHGPFYGGLFSLLRRLDDGSVHDRFYGCLMEPGSLAMFLLPVMAYAFFNKKYVSLVVFVAAFLLTRSLGGALGLMMLIVVAPFFFRKKQRAFPVYLVVLTALSVSTLWSYLGEYVTTAYELRNYSRTARVDNVSNTIEKLPSLLLNNPIGYKLAENTGLAEENEMWFGSTFTPGNMLQVGGVCAFLGYSTCLFVSSWIALMSIKRIKLSREEQTVFSSLLVLLPFIVQRGSVWESAIFAFLFAPSIIRVLQSSRHYCDAPV